MRTSALLMVLLLLACTGNQKNGHIPQKTPESEQHVNIVSPSGETLYDYIHHPDLDAPVRAFLQRELELQNDPATKDLLDILVNHQGELTSLYFGVFNKICKEADEGMSELLGQAAMTLLENHTAFCIASLHNGAPDYFTGHISNALYTQEGWENTLKTYSSNLYKTISDDPELILELNHLMEGIKNDIGHLSVKE